MTVGRVVVLDDNPAVGATVSMLAQRLGHEVQHTTDVLAFLGLVSSWQPTHLVIDLLMPEVDGISVLAALSSQACEASIVIVSGVDQRIIEAARLFAVENGLQVAGTLHKPIGAHALEALLTLDAPLTVPSQAGPAQVRTVPLEDLAAAVASPGDLRVAYQPKVRVGDGSLAGFEALVRWTHPTLGPVLPSALVRLAEQNGLIDDLTYRVLERALPWFADLDSSPGTTISINLSARTLNGQDLVDRLIDLCEKTGVDPVSVVLELTETSRPEDPVMSLGLLTRLRVRGFRLSLDDFGTGYSTMSELARLPFSEIKVDQSFVTTALSLHESRSVVRSVIELGRRLSLTVTAEGVEDPATLDLMRVLGVDLVQGFGIARPLSPEVASAWSGPSG